MQEKEIPRGPVLELELPSPGHTDTLGVLLGRTALPGDVILLSGTLGAGKTTLTRSIARGLGVPAEYYVTSPSFSLMHEYPARIPLYHIDCYRLDSEDDVEGSGLIDYIVADGLTVVEWPDRLGSLKPLLYLDIELDIASENGRLVRLNPVGVDWQTRLDRLQKEHTVSGNLILLDAQ